MYVSPLPSPPRPPRVRKGARERLREAIEALCSDQARVARHGETSWASITFAGARHRFDLIFDGATAVEAGEIFIAALPEHEFAISGHLVAEAIVTSVDHRADPPRLAVTCELLLLEDG